MDVKMLSTEVMKDKLSSGAFSCSPERDFDSWQLKNWFSDIFKVAISRECIFRCTLNHTTYLVAGKCQLC